METSSPSAEARCANCGAQAVGNYCANCGQPTFALQMPLGVFLRGALHEVFALDSRIFRTLGPLLLKPGHVTRDYVSGHRARYVPPFRLYIILSFLLFLVLALAPTENSQFFQVSSDSADAAEVDSSIAADSSVLETLLADSILALGGLDTAEVLTSELTQRLQRAAYDPDQFLEHFRSRMAQAMFFLLPMFALLLKVLYRKRFYVEHLVFSIYFHCFVFVVVILVTCLGFFSLGSLDSLGDILMLILPVYLVLGMKKVYGQGWWKTLIKASALGFTHMVIVGVTLGAALFATLWFL